MSLKVKLFIIGFTLESREREGERKGKSACVCGRERKREREQKLFWQKKSFIFNALSFSLS